MSDRPLRRTGVPGVYSRGGRFVALYRDAGGGQRKVAAATLEDAIRAKTNGQQQAERERREAAKKAKAAREAKRGAARASLDHAYSQLRLLLQQLDATQAHLRPESRGAVQRALLSIYEAEDDITKALRWERRG